MSRNIHSEYHDAQKLEPHVQPAEIVRRLAEKYGIGEHQAALEAGMMEAFPSYRWPQIAIDTSFEEAGYTQCDIFKILEKDNFGKFVGNIADMMKFPRNSALLHALSCVASAMTIKKMRYQSGRWNGPVNLYTIVSQPPSTAKSAINETFSGVIDDYVENVMEDEANSRLKEMRIEKKELERKMKGASLREQAEIECEIEDITEEMKTIKKPVYAVTDTTPEALQIQARNQGGWWAIVTAEQGLINKVFGLNYGSGRAADLDFVLQSFNGEKSKVLRVGRDGFSVRAVGSVALIVQDIGIENLMRMGETGQGLPERFNFMRERSFLGHRDRLQNTSYPQKGADWYKGFIEGILSGDDGLIFKFSDKCKRLVDEKMNDYEPHMKDGGKYSNTLLQGSIGKGDGQIYRFASIIHALRTWNGKTLKTLDVEEKSVMDAINIYDQLKDSFVQSAGNQGYAGDEAMLKATIDALVELTGTNGGKKKTTVLPNGVHVISVRKFRESKRGTQPFKGHAQLTEVLDTMFELLSEAGVCAYHSKKVYISPNMLN